MKEYAFRNESGDDSDDSTGKNDPMRDEINEDSSKKSSNVSYESVIKTFAEIKVRLGSDTMKHGIHPCLILAFS